ncbi:hypothetical protein LYSHEL_14110 [Lysobacter helvus]|uniref:2OG-Fe dioxygenase family protein n=3 Tax=Lysobacterales TaxID=135614 RepID=A0ABN6FWZ6_9GAMM|nr:hypothetical protein LYSCAS_14110 [Lysobacter caseinilyticus]BCT95540.1 hypothetical protein LYSHEL_14110 [Lysobacter helvus]
MDEPGPVEASQCVAVVREAGFCFVHAETMRPALERFATLSDWAMFAASWDALGPDPYLERTGRARRRRHGVFRWAEGTLTREPHQPHFQSLAYNRLQGDVDRWFDPIVPEVGDSASLRAVLGFSCEFFGALAPEVSAWRIEVHQFRIEARSDAAGEPTPEGVHRDGVDYVLVLMVDRANIASGTTTIHSADGTLLGSFTLHDPLDAALVDDARVFHGVTPVTPVDAAKPAHRDVLVVTLKRE